MQNHDAVVSTLGPREVFKPSSMLHDSALATTRAMNRAGVKRLVVLSAAAHFPGFSIALPVSSCETTCAIHSPMEAIVQASGLDWTIARPPRLTEEDYIDLSKPGECRSQDGFQPVPQSRGGVHARRDRTKETFPQGRGYREITCRFLNRPRCPR